MKRLTSLIALIVALIYGYTEYTDITTYSRSYEARVIAVSDGDTITVKLNRRKQKIRLFGVDCPEKLQPYGKAATMLTQQLAFKKLVRVIPMHKDRYGRMVAYVNLPGGKRLNYELVSSGLAWWAQKYAPKEMRLALCEIRARMKNRGLWQDADPIPPWEYRKGIR